MTATAQEAADEIRKPIFLTANELVNAYHTVRRHAKSDALTYDIHDSESINYLAKCAIEIATKEQRSEGLASLSASQYAELFWDYVYVLCMARPKVRV